VRRLVPLIALALMAAGCHAAVDPARAEGGPGTSILRPSPFTVITEGPVHAVVPEHWSEAPLSGDGSLREGLVASPNLERWRNLDGTVPGIEVAWVDETQVGIPSDYFYLAAKWPILPKLASSHRCRRSFQQVIVDHHPVFNRLHERFGDFAARASGTCSDGRHVNRWAYFVAAPSYGPVRHVGLRNSGLYMVVAVIRDGPTARDMLHKVLYETRFGQTTVGQLVLAARESAQLQ